MEPSQNTSLRRLVTIPAICLPLFASFFYFVWFPGTAFGNSFYAGVKFFMIIWPFVAVWLILKEKFHERNGPRNHKMSLLVGAAFGVLTVGVLLILMKLTPVGGMVYDNAGRIAQRITDLGIKDYYLLFALFVSILHAALEEFFWRYFAYGQLRKMISVPAAVFVAGIGFAAHHIVVLTQFVSVPLAVILGLLVGIGGAVWSVIYQRYNSLWGAWFSHMIIDFGIMWIGWEILQMVG